jgi:PST family polysaccharide transporter
LLVLAILGRLLTPKEFGLFGIATAVQMLFLPILDMGLIPAFLKIKNVEDHVSDVFFTINFYIGILSAGMMIFIAPLAADFYGDSLIKPILFVFSISLFFSPLAGQPTAILSRNHRFDLLAKVQILISITGGVLVVFLAFYKFGVWSLVYRTIFESAFKAFLLIKISRKNFSIVGLGKIFMCKNDLLFALSTVQYRLFNCLNHALDKIFIGKISGIESLGLYSRAYQLAILPDSRIRAVIVTPILSYIAQIEEEKRLSAIYLNIYWIVVATTVLPCFFIVIAGDWIMPCFLGENWTKAGPLLQCLGLYGAGRALRGIGEIYYLNQKNISLWSKYSFYCVILYICLPFLAIKNGLFYFSLFYSLSFFCYWFIFLCLALSIKVYKKEITQCIVFSLMFFVYLFVFTFLIRYNFINLLKIDLYIKIFLLFFVYIVLSSLFFGLFYRIYFKKFIFTMDSNI